MLFFWQALRGVGCPGCDQWLSVSYLHIHRFLSCFVVLEWNSEPHFCFATLFPVWTLHRGGARGSQQGGRGRKDFPVFPLSSCGLQFLCGFHDHHPTNTLHPGDSPSAMWQQLNQVWSFSHTWRIGFKLSCLRETRSNWPAPSPQRSGV